jgi:hypothetical protein
LSTWSSTCLPTAGGAVTPCCSTPCPPVYPQPRHASRRHPPTARRHEFAQIDKPFGLAYIRRHASGERAAASTPACRAAEGAHPQTLRQKDRPRRNSVRAASAARRAFRTLESGSSPCERIGKLPTEGARAGRSRRRNLSGIEDRGAWQGFTGAYRPRIPRIARSLSRSRTCANGTPRPR